MSGHQLERLFNQSIAEQETQGTVQDNNVDDTVATAAAAATDDDDDDDDDDEDNNDNDADAVIIVLDKPTKQSPSSSLRLTKSDG